MSGKIYDVGGVAMARPFKVRRLGHLGLSHADVEAGTTFYGRLLGFRISDPVRASPDGPALGYFTTYGTDHHALVHIDARVFGADPFLAAGVTVNQISFQVGSLQEVTEAYHYFRDQGFITDNGPPIQGIGRDFPGSNWALYLYGPGGHIVELYYGMEQVGWQRRSKPRALYLNARTMESNPHLVPTLPQRSELQEILDVEANASSQLDLGHRDEGVAGEPFDHMVGGVLLQRPFSINKVGPASFFVEDVAESEAFYVTHLGLVRTEEVLFKGHRAVFLRSGAEHHTIALFPLALRETLGFDPRTRLMSWGVEVGSYRQLRDAREFLRKRNVPMVDIPSELYPGIDYAFHVRDPSGHHVMLYYYMEQIGWQGVPRPRDARRPIDGTWPELLTPLTDTYMDQVRQGPLA
jgi:catechol-2,3-dioxygenase